MSKTTTHAERTAAEPRQCGLHAVKLCRIQRVAPSVRLLTLALPYTLKFLPGQWVDLHIPSLPLPGGFTITSSPAYALASGHAPAPLRYSPLSAIFTRFPSPDAGKATAEPVGRPFIELAIQRTSNPPAQWLWQPEESIVDSELQIRVGGSFTWPPQGWDPARKIDRVVFVAGGVGINPFVSMLSAMFESPETMPAAVEVLYSSRPTSSVRETLFLERLVGLFENFKGRQGSKKIKVHFTADSNETAVKHWAEALRTEFLEIRKGRISKQDLETALGSTENRSKETTIAYVCGPGPMVDEVVARVESSAGMDRGSVFYERWW